MAHRSVDLTNENIDPRGWASPIISMGGLVGIVCLVLAAGLLVSGFVGQGAKYFWHAYLHSFVFFLSLSLGGLFFVMLHHLTRAGWSTVLRRIAEGIACTLPLMAVLALPLLVLVLTRNPVVYEWAAAGFGDVEGSLEEKKALYLNPAFFTIRSLFYFGVWITLALLLLRWSVRQDKTGDEALTHRLHNLSAPGMALFALTTTFFAFDYLMSLEYLWFSTIFGVYYFAGCFLGFLALLVVLVQWLQATGRMRYAITTEHFQDLGKLVFAFIVFWAYIAFSQYMLIWYGDIPEETHWYLIRQTGEWQYLSIFLILGHFIIPFFALISRIPKRRKHLLLIGALWVLFVHWIDHYWLVFPYWVSKLGAEEALLVPKGIGQILCSLLLLAGMGGLFLAATAYSLRGQALLPERDPRLPESLSFENA